MLQPKMRLAVEYRPIDELVPCATNARLHSPAQVAKIAASIARFGFNNPILIDAQDIIVAGHGRVLAAQQLALPEVPVIRLGHLSDDERRAYMLADNRIALDGSWDEALLALEMARLRDAGFELPLLGFADDEVTRLLLASAAEGLTDPDDVPELPKTPISRRGDVWLLDRHRLLCGDATSAEDVTRVLGGVRPHLMITDPPYGVDYDPAWRAKAGINKNRGKMGTVINDDVADWRAAWALFPGSVAYVWSAPGPLQVVSFDSLASSEFEIRQQIIWAKDRFALGRGHYHYQHEPCWYAVRKGATGHWMSDRSQTTLWNIPAREDSGHGHGTQKPVECMKRPIENNSSPGQAVYDPFVGSGTTIIAAEMTGRTCHALEIDPAYCDVAVERWQNFTGKSATREAA